MNSATQYGSMEMQMLKGNNSSGLELPPTMRRKDQEFIDHTMLPAEYIRDTSELIMDMIEKPAVVHMSSAVTNGADFAVKDHALPADLNFQEPLFQFVSKPNLDAAPVSNVSAVDGATTTNTVPTDFITLNGDFLTNTGSKEFYSPVAESHHVSTEAATVQQFPSLTLLSEAINESGGLLSYTRSNARKVLPHKKRISRKLTTGQEEDEEPIMPSALEQHKVPETRLPVVGSMQFSCELCGHSTSSQLDFFEHLKQHYEPLNSQTILASKKTSYNPLQSAKQDHNICDMAEKPPAVVNNVDPVFSDVQLNFADFQNVGESVVPTVINSTEDHNIKIINASDMDNRLSYVTVPQTDNTPLKDNAAVEVEFSDNEDMLEGIRNVVDKVSIEDTSDEFELLTTNSMRVPWFTNAFSNIAFRNQSHGDESTVTLPPLSVAPSTNEVPATTVANEQQISCVTDAKRLIIFTDTNTTATEQSNVYYTTTTDCVDSIIQTMPTVVTTTISEKLPPATVLTGTPTTAAHYSDLAANGNGFSHLDERAVEHYDNFAKDGEEKAEEEEQHDEREENGSDDEAEEPIEKVPKTKPQHYCTKCSRCFNSVNALKYHNRTHTGIRPHRCEVCEKSFLAQSALKSHLRTHTGDKPFQCDFCQRKFGQWSDLTYHTISIHSGEKRHQCEFCGKAFSRKYSLVLHRRIHTSECNYKCEFCDKSFRASTYLQNHRKIHTGEKPYSCTTCGKKFRVSGDLSRHMRVHLRPPRTKRDRRSKAKGNNKATTTAADAANSTEA